MVDRLADYVGVVAVTAPSPSVRPSPRPDLAMSTRASGVTRWVSSCTRAHLDFASVNGDKLFIDLKSCTVYYPGLLLEQLHLFEIQFAIVKIKILSYLLTFVLGRKFFKKFHDALSAGGAFKRIWHPGGIPTFLGVG